MNKEINIVTDESIVPYYAVHKDGLISGFFGLFRFLSNFYPVEEGIWYEELLYPSTENAYQAAKWPPDQRSQFVDISPGKSKLLSKKNIPNFDGNNWKKKKLSIMSALVTQKFNVSKKLRNMLLVTDGYVLEERNNWGDVWWGVDVNGHGENNLGKILMTVRSNIKLSLEQELF